MRSAEVTKPVLFTDLPSPDETGKVACVEVAKWCVLNLIEMGDINARMQRIRDAE